VDGRVPRSGCGVEADGFGEACLTVVEGPEFLGFELEGACDVECVEGADAEGGAKATGEFYACFPGAMRKWSGLPHSGSAVALETPPCCLCFCEGDTPNESLAVDCIRHFTPAKWGQTNIRRFCHSANNRW